MRLRRQIIGNVLQENEEVTTLGLFPRIGCESYLTANGSDAIDNSSAFGSITRKHRAVTDYIQGVRQEYGGVTAKVYQDVNTPEKACEPDFVFAGALQVTIQATNLKEMRIIHDNMVVISPLMLAMSASSPIVKGRLLDSDTRWQLLNQFYRQPHQYDQHAVGFGKACGYLSSGFEHLNDLNYPYDDNVYSTFLRQDVDKLMAKYYASKFVLQPMYLLRESLGSSEDECTLLQQGVESSSKGVVKLQLPTSPKDGWRLEFRICDVQLTDFQNAAFVAFLVLFARAVSYFNLDFRIPISKVEENVEKASKINAVTQEKFWFKSMKEKNADGHDISELVTLDYTTNGKVGEFEGFIPIIKRYLITSQEFNDAERSGLHVYLDYMSGLAKGEFQTTASWMRSFVTSHTEYKQDSTVTEKIQFDLLKACGVFVAKDKVNH